MQWRHANNFKPIETLAFQMISNVTEHYSENYSAFDHKIIKFPTIWKLFKNNETRVSFLAFCVSFLMHENRFILCLFFNAWKPAYSLVFLKWKSSLRYFKVYFWFINYTNPGVNRQSNHCDSLVFYLLTNNKTSVI